MVHNPFVNYNILRGYYTPKISIFCVLSQNYQHFKKNHNICILKQIVQGTKNGIEILVGQAVLKLAIKTVEIFFDQ